MKKQRYVTALAAALLALGATSALAAGGGHGAGGMGGESGGHMSAQAMSDSNGFKSADRDKGLGRAADRSDTIADRSGVQPGKGHKHGKSHTSKP
jgi:hypothetical protein